MRGDGHGAMLAAALRADPDLSEQEVASCLARGHDHHRCGDTLRDAQARHARRHSQGRSHAPARVAGAHRDGGGDAAHPDDDPRPRGSGLARVRGERRDPRLGDREPRLVRGGAGHRRDGCLGRAVAPRRGDRHGARRGGGRATSRASASGRRVAARWTSRPHGGWRHAVASASSAQAPCRRSIHAPWCRCRSRWG